MDMINPDDLHDLIRTMPNNVGLRLTDHEDGYKVERVTTEHLKEQNRRKDKLNIACLLIRGVTGVFCSTLENLWYTPGTPKNSSFGCIYFKWQDMVYAIITIPIEDKPKAEAVAKRVGARIADGIPTLIGGPDPKINFAGIPAEQFPLNNQYTFTLEGP